MNAQNDRLSPPDLRRIQRAGGICFHATMSQPVDRRLDMLNTVTVKGEMVVHMLSELEAIRSNYPGSSANLTLHTHGGGSYVIYRSLMAMDDPENGRVAIDFDEEQALEALEIFRARVVEKFGT
jgi:hypothetical protein